MAQAPIRAAADVPVARADPPVSKWAWSAAVAAAVVPAAILAATVRRYGVDLPYFDEWGFAGFLQKSLRGKLHLSNFFAQHTAHRLVFPRLILLATARATGWDTRYELAVNLVLGWLVAGVFGFWAANAAETYRSRACLVLVPVFSLILLSLSQFENWMWGWQNQIFLVVLTSSSALMVLSRPRVGLVQTAAAMALAFIATYSFANGLLTWPLGLLALLYPRYREVPVRRWLVALWVGVMIVVFIAYFHDFSFPPRYNKAAADWKAPINSVEYFLAYLGGPFAMFTLGLGVAIGAFGLLVSSVLAAYLAITRPVRADAYLPGLLVWLFGLGSALQTTLGRADFGPLQALSSRYATIANLFWIGTLMMFAALCFAPAAEGRRSARASRRSRAAYAALVLALTAATVRADAFGMDSIRQFSHLEQVLRYKLLQGARDDQMLMLAPNLKWLETFKTVAEKNHLWAWRPKAPASMFDPPPVTYDGQMSAPPGPR